MKLIDKAATVAEINRLIENAPKNDKFYVIIDQLNLLKHKINTIEVKEVDSKDAFIEKACEWLQEEVVNDYEGLVWENLIEDFKNYMKGE